MKTPSSPFVLALVCLAFFAGGLSAGGLSCSLGEVVVENLQTGMTYDLTELANTRVIVTNTDEHTVLLRMDVLAPAEEELKLEAEPIPDLSWLQLSANEFSLSTGQQAESRITLVIPDNAEYRNRRFQVMIWSHTLPTAESGMFLACGIKSRLIFSLNGSPPEYATPQTGKHASALRLEPQEIYWSDRSKEPSLTIVNDGESSQSVNVVLRQVSQTYSALTPGYSDCQWPSNLLLSETNIELAPHSKKTIQLRVSPSADDLAFDNCMAIVEARTDAGAVQSSVYSRLYLSAR